MGEIVAGIDIGTTKVTAMIGMIGDKQDIVILGKGIERCDGIKKDVFSDLDHVADTVKAVFKQAQIMANVPVSSVFINIPCTQIELMEQEASKELKNPEEGVCKSDLQRVCDILRENVTMSMDKQIIDVVPLEYRVDDGESLENPISVKGEVLTVKALLVIAKSQFIHNLQKVVEVLGVNVDGILMEPVVCGEVLLTEEEQEKGVLTVDVGGEATYVSIIKGHELIYHHAVYLGGESISRDIALGLKIPIFEGERIKRECEVALSEWKQSDTLLLTFDSSGQRKEVVAGDVAEIIEARAEEIIQLAFEAFRNSGIKRSQLSGVVVYGAGISYMDGMQELAQRVFEMPLRFPLYKGVEGMVKPEYLTVYGLLKYGASQPRFKGLHALSETVNDKVTATKNNLFEKIKVFFGG